MQTDNNLSEVLINGEVFYKIANVHNMRPFFMSIVSDSNHWLFLSSNGGISAGRKNSEYALFPYYTDDKITDTAEITGSKTIVRINSNGQWIIWEPFSVRSEGRFELERNLYQNKYSNKIIFEEVNHSLGLSFQYEWNSSNLYGFVKKSTIKNIGDAVCTFDIVDGLQNILPFGIPSDLQTKTSNLADAYKRTELISKTGVGIYALSAIIVDKAEPSEALKANVVWQLGFENPTYLLSTLQLQAFREGETLTTETDIKAEKGAYFMVGSLNLQPQAAEKWLTIGNVNQTHANIIDINNSIIADTSLALKVAEDIALGTQQLISLAAAADGLQFTNDDLKDTRHFSNVLFNIMRGGIFDNDYQIEKWDFEKYIQKANNQCFAKNKAIIDGLNEMFTVSQLADAAQNANDTNFTRLATEYLPLKFSRRHGDPSRPWNQFSINTRSEVDGSKILDYQGNWRDIFQNWEALAHAYPGFIKGMIYKFLNASTFDGYNPYRVTKDGFDWETIEPDNPWSYIGYWGDHQIIYLLKFLEFAENHQSGAIANLFDTNHFVYANVPYRIKSYENIVKNPKDTIEFDHENEKKIHARMHELGADGALLHVSNQDIYYVNFIEKILATALSKLSNFIPEGGIWMNTQRPEWNDANNALVGNGLSMVTLCYLRRFLKFMHSTTNKSGVSQFEISAELHQLFEAIFQTFNQNTQLLKGAISNADRKKIADALGIAGSNYRTSIYNNQFSGTKQTITKEALLNFFTITLQFMEHSIAANLRKDGLYHAYNLLTYQENGIEVAYLSEMLEGQVAALSSQYLNAEQSLQLLNALKQSSLYRKDQNSYILYPNKQLPGFLERNNIPQASFHSSQLLTQLAAMGNTAIAEKDSNNQYHFNGNFKNANDVATALKQLPAAFQPLVEAETNKVLAIFEQVFNHKEFTGRSGTFYGYEGLGSIYWHMVSKLAVAVQESCIWAIEANADANTVSQLIEHYYNVVDGIGVHKSPKVYGAFPFTPYSHTPFSKGAQQPGMTGQVKEDILTRIGELGVTVVDKKLSFKPHLLKSAEFLSQEKKALFTLTSGKRTELALKPGSLAFTVCQTPVIYQQAEADTIAITYNDGTVTQFNGHAVDASISSAIFNRTADNINYVTVFIQPKHLL